MDPRAHARRTDPGTSHEAAASVDKIRLSQDAVLTILRENGPMHDQRLIALYRAQYERRGWPKQSESGIRSRRSELVDLGRVEDSGEKVRLESGRSSIVWRQRAAADQPVGTLF